MRRVVGLVVVLVLVGACGPEAADDEPPASSLATTTTTAPVTTVPTTSTTTTSVERDDQPVDYLVFGEDGLTVVVDGVTVPLVERPVAWAASDGQGAILFIRHGPVWTEPLRIEPGDEPTASDLPMGAPALIAGRRAWVTTVVDEEAAAVGCDPAHHDFRIHATVAIDLANGSKTLLWCQEEDPDFGNQVRAGGDTMVILGQGGVGCCNYSGPLRFMGLDAGPLAHPTSPFPESGTYELAAALDPLGQALAYVHRPQSLCPEVCSDEAVKEWYRSRPAPTLTVLDLSTGNATFRRRLAEDDRLVDFDGRYAVVVKSQSDATTSSIIDTVGDIPVLEVTGEARLLHEFEDIEAKAPALVVTQPRSGDAVMGEILRFEGRVRPGWGVTSGRYEADVDESGHWTLPLSLSPGGNVATLTAIGPDGTSTDVRVPVYRVDAVVLRGDGLGMVGFGEPAELAANELESTLGPPTSVSPRDGFGFRDAWWPHLGLTVRYAVGEFYRTDGVEHLAGWEYWPPGDGLLGTSEGVTVGSTLTEAQSAHPGAVPSTSADEVCFGGRYSFIEDPGSQVTMRILIHVTDDDVIRGMSAGVGRGC